LLALEKRALGKTLSEFEDAPREAAEQRHALLVALQQHPACRDAFIIGVTGAPGAGKSTLVGSLALRLIGGADAARVAVLAIDPSSQQSGGALLGDRIRVQFPIGERRLFFRSQASALAHGGLGRATYSVSRLLVRLFDYLIVETVGSGQSETGIAALADCTCLVLQPMSGDQIQFMKAGLMEVADILVLNKADLSGADATLAALSAGGGMAERSGQPVPIARVSALNGAGMDELAAQIIARQHRPRVERAAERESHFFKRWVADEFGKLGLELLERRGGGAPAYLARAGGFEPAQADFDRELRHWLVESP
jgi:LAO/AO transport system kinase